MRLMFEEMALSPSYDSMNADQRLVVRCLRSFMNYLAGWNDQFHWPVALVAKKYAQLVANQEAETFLFELTRQMPWEVKDV